MKPRLRVLIVDDSDDDARLLVRELTRGGYDVTSGRVETAPELTRALADGEWELILCDFSLPHFSGEAALRLVRSSGVDVPFIYVSGTIGEEVAVEAMKAGADDYVMKDRLTRLVPAVQRELRETEERHRAERGLRKQIRMNEALFSQAITNFALFDRDYRILQVNESYAAYYGRTPAEFKGLSFSEVRSAGQSAEAARAILDEVVRTKAPLRFTSYPYEFEQYPERGITYWDSIVQPILDEQGEIEFLFFSAVDVTERKRAEEALRANTARLLQQESALIALTRKKAGDDDVLSSLRRISEVSSRTLNVARLSIWRYNQTRTALVCVDLHELESDRHSAGMELAIADCPRYLQALTEDDVIAADAVEEEPRFGELLESYLQPLGITSMMDASVLSNGVLAGVVCHEHVGPPRKWTLDERTFAVATANVVALVLEEWERKEAEKALRLSQQAYASLVNSIEGIVWEADAETLRFQFVSKQAERLLGYPTERWLTDPSFWVDHVHPDDRGWAVEFCLESTRRRTDHDFKYRMVAADGRVVWLHDLVTVVVQPGQPVLLRGIMVDITEARRADEALRSSEQRFRQVTENIDEVFWLTDVLKQEMIYISPAYSRVWGRSCESLVADPSSWLEAIHPDDRDRVRDAAMTRQIEGAYDVEYRIVRPDGSIRWVHDRAFPIADSDGRVYRVAGVAEDITSRLQLEEQLRQSQKMEAIGQLAGGVAHDFNNLLAVIQMQSSLLLTVPSTAAAMHEGLQEIMAASERAANLTRQLLTFSRRDVRQARDIDLADVTDSMTKLLRRILGEDVALETRVAHALPLVNADPGMMEQVLMNLAVNARDAMPQGGQLLVGLDVVEIDEDEIAAEPSATHVSTAGPSAGPGRYVRLRVRDTGFGIASSDLPRIFEPFFTTKEAGKGTGLGLATVFGIVEQHHGWIEVSSEVGHGATFEIFLPALPSSRSPSQDAVSEGGLPRGTESILLVEDDAAVRALARLSLEHCGYRVHEAESAAAALVLWETLPAPVDLLVTDLIMPGGMSGRELADVLTARRPQLKVIYNSGYSNDVVHRELRLTPGYNFLQKPYPVAELATVVRRCLDG